MSEFSLPDHLGDAARAFFEQIRRERRLRGESEFSRLLQAVEMWDRAEWCRREVDRLGLTLTDRFGQKKPNPLCDLERKLRVSVDDIIHRLPLRQTIADLESELKDLGQ